MDDRNTNLAIELDESINSSGAVQSLMDQLKSYQGIPVPTQEQVRFKKDDYDIPIPATSGANRYNYTSDSAAERAALQEFERAMYSQIDAIILRIITEYRIKRLKPYYSSVAEEGSVYAASNEKVSEILAGIKNLVGKALPSDFTTVDIFPNTDLTWKMLQKGELVSDELVSAVKSEFDYPASQYDCYLDTDDMEVYVGEDWRGNAKYKDKYCYRTLSSAFMELAKDLKNACGYASDKLENAAIQHISWLVQEYNRQLKECIMKKLQMIE